MAALAVSTQDGSAGDTQRVLRQIVGFAAGFGFVGFLNAIALLGGHELQSKPVQTVILSGAVEGAPPRGSSRGTDSSTPTYLQPAPTLMLDSRPDGEAWICAVCLLSEATR